MVYGLRFTVFGSHSLRFSIYGQELGLRVKGYSLGFIQGLVFRAESKRLSI